MIEKEINTLPKESFSESKNHCKSYSYLEFKKRQRKKKKEIRNHHLELLHLYNMKNSRTIFYRHHDSHGTNLKKTSYTRTGNCNFFETIINLKKETTTNINKQVIKETVLPQRNLS